MRRRVTVTRVHRLRATLTADAVAAERRAANDAAIERAQACYAAESYLRELRRGWLCSNTAAPRRPTSRH